MVDWQLHDTTSFIRMMSPDAGGIDQVTQNRGYVAIPEVGDQVMVGFVHNHPDRPLVMGCMFHGQVGLGGGPITELNPPRQEAATVLSSPKLKVITNKSGNEIHLGTTGSNISITALNLPNVTFNQPANNVPCNKKPKQFQLLWFQ